MNVNLLRQIHFTIYRRGKLFNYPENIPKNLPSLEKEDPSTSEINADYRLLRTHFKHPVFNNFVPTYDEMVINPESAWAHRYLETYMMK
jgi:hypothetical protein